MRSRLINTGLIYIILGSLGLAEGIRLILRTGIAYGPGQYLAVISGLIVLVGAYYYAQEIRNAKKIDPTSAIQDETIGEDDEEPADELPQGVARVFKINFHLAGREVTIGTMILSFVMFTLYGVFAKPIGYLASTILFVVACMLLFGERIWWKIALFSVITSSVFWYIFIQFAKIPL